MTAYVRFFKNKEDTIPFHSDPLKQYADAEQYLYQAIREWMKSAPEGKVDVVMLNP